MRYVDEVGTHLFCSGSFFFNIRAYINAVRTSSSSTDHVLHSSRYSTCAYSRHITRYVIMCSTCVIAAEGTVVVQ